MSETIIIQSLKEAYFFIKEIKSVQKKIIAFSPDIRLILEKNNYKNIYPKLNTNFKNDNITKNLIYYHSSLEKNLKDSKLIFDHVEETFINIFFSTLSSIEYIKLLIQNNENIGPWSIFVKGKLIQIKNYDRLIELIIKNQIMLKEGIFLERRPISYKYNKIFDYLYYLINKIIIRKVKKK